MSFPITHFRIFFVISFILQSPLLFAQDEETPFPLLEGVTVKDSVIILPDTGSGKFALIGLAFSKKADKSLQTWMQPIYDRFIAPKYSKNPFAVFAYDINTYFIPMFSGINAAAARTAKKKALDKLHPQLHNYVVFYKGSLKDYKDVLQLDDRKIPYIFLVGPEGNISYATSGDFSKEKIEKIESILDAREE